MYEYKSTITGPKSADAVPFIKNLAWELGLKLEIDVDETGWLFKTQHIRFKVIDKEDKKCIEMFISRLCASIEDYNV